MTKEDKEHLQNKQLTESILISCLVTCESVISRNAYLKKKWKNAPYIPGDEIGGLEYQIKRLQWMAHREKIRSLLLTVYSMKQIIQMTKSCAAKSTQREVKDVIEMIHRNEYTLVVSDS